MGSVELAVLVGKDLKNVNWRHGPLAPYVVAWVDPSNKYSSKVDREGDSFPVWGETLSIPLPPGPAADAVLYLDVVHAGSESDTKPLVGSAQLKLRDVVDDVGYGERTKRILQLKRPSGRPHGKVDIKISVREAPRYGRADPYYAAPPAYGGQPTDAAPPQQYGYPYSSQPRDGYYSNAPPPPAGYPGAYVAPAVAPQAAYGQSGYGDEQGSYGQPSGGAQGSYGQPVADKKKSKFGMGTGLAVGAVAGVLGGLALGEGIDYVEDKIADDAADKVEDDYYDDDDDY